MKGFKDKSGKFRPTENKKGIRKARDSSQKLQGIKLPKFDIKLPDRKETYSELISNIQRNAVQREELINKNEALAEKILANPTSEFNESWREQIKQNSRVVRDVNNDIKHDIGKLTQVEKKQLPNEIKNLTRFL